MHDQSPLYGLSDPQDHSLGSQDASTEYSYDASTLPYVPYSTQPLPTTPAQGENEALPDLTPSLPPQYVQSSTEKLSSDLPKRRRLWFGLGLGLALVLLVFATTAIYGYVNRPTPQKTLDVFCSALQAENYPEAYGQFTPALQGQFSEQDFALVLARDKVVTCTHGTVSDANSTTSTNLKLIHKSHGVNNDTIFLTKDSRGAWRINDLQRVS